MKLTTILIAAILGMALPATAQNPAGELIFSQPSDGQSAYGPSLLSTNGAVNSEIADDFYFIGHLDRVLAEGFIFGGLGDFHGVYVRLYESTADSKPGALQAEYFAAAGDSNVVFNQSGEIDVTLSPPFAAQGKHFISVQPVIDYWYWWSANSGAARGESFYFRDLASGQTNWIKGDNQPFSITNADVSFFLFGSVGGPGEIARLGTNALARSGYLEIFGANFGGSGQVLVNGLAALVANWTSTAIVVYVPEATPLATVSVQVVTAGGASNAKQLTVMPRQAEPKVNWRFRMDGPYASVRPAVGPDNTLYCIDVFQHLYAISPDGGLKWLVRGAGNKGVAVGLDNTIYVASEDFIKAFNPNGSLKWTFVQNPRALTCLGVSVGPDGNIYSVSTEGLGVFSLTPAGVLRWQQPEPYRRPIVDYGEIVFGPNGANQQLYFYANTHLRALRLDGTAVFTLSGFGQPAIGPDGSVHSVLGAYSPNGNLLWSFLSPYPYNTFTAPNVGSDGVHYFVQNLGQLFALNPGGSQRWHVTVDGYVAGPVVDPSNTRLLMGSGGTLDMPGFFLAANAQTGSELWRVALPPEDTNVFNPSTGQYGFNQFVDTRARFTADGLTAYFVTATATGDNNTSKSFVYSLNVTGTNAAPAKKMQVSSISLGLRSQSMKAIVSGVVTVKDTSGIPMSGATVKITWLKPDGQAVRASAVTLSNGNAQFGISGRQGTYTLKVDDVVKTGYTLDVRGSTLSKSITSPISEATWDAPLNAPSPPRW